MGAAQGAASSAVWCAQGVVVAGSASFWLAAPMATRELPKILFGVEGVDVVKHVDFAAASAHTHTQTHTKARYKRTLLGGLLTDWV